MKLYALKYKNYYLNYIFDEVSQREFLTKENIISNAIMYDDLEDAKNMLKELKEGNIKLFTKQNEVEEIKNKTYILEIELKEIGEIEND